MCKAQEIKSNGIAGLRRSLNAGNKTQLTWVQVERDVTGVGKTPVSENLLFSLGRRERKRFPRFVVFFFFGLLLP